jgi:putative transcriptional regulator
MGLVINRPTEFETDELLGDLEAVSGYSGPIFWGGPVEMNSARALLRTDTPPEGSELIADSVYRVPIGDWLRYAPTNPTRLRFFIGYAGWAGGQLDREMALGSWHVVPASDGHVFADDPATLWKRLTPPRQHRVVLH